MKSEFSPRLVNNFHSLGYSIKTSQRYFDVGCEAFLCFHKQAKWIMLTSHLDTLFELIQCVCTSW